MWGASTCINNFDLVAIGMHIRLEWVFHVDLDTQAYRVSFVKIRKRSFFGVQCEDYTPASQHGSQPSLGPKRTKEF